MKKQSGFFLLVPLVALCACDPLPVQYPPGSAQNPYANPNAPAATSQVPEVSGSQRWQHAWSKALEGVFMGSSIAGPYGAGGGLVIGLIAGLVTADSHYGQINNQIQAEQKKDQQLEAAIEQELARQRDLENQLAGAPDPSPAARADQSIPAKTPAQPAPLRSPAGAAAGNSEVAALTKPASTPATPSPFKNVEVRDVNGDGVADLWLYYNPQKPAEIIRQEEASQADGRVDTWSYFKDGEMVRREVDTRQSGRADTVYFYDRDKLVREERDESGRGSITYRAIYQDGRLAKVERDSSGGGRADLWIYYDVAREGEIVVKDERDLNGDGIPDLWSYYENGRLARRDVSALGLEILARKDQLPAPAAELSHASMPGS